MQTDTDTAPTSPARVAEAPIESTAGCWRRDAPCASSALQRHAAAGDRAVQHTEGLASEQRLREAADGPGRRPSRLALRLGTVPQAEDALATAAFGLARACEDLARVSVAAAFAADRLEAEALRLERLVLAEEAQVEADDMHRASRESSSSSVATAPATGSLSSPRPNPAVSAGPAANRAADGRY